MANTEQTTPSGEETPAVDSRPRTTTSRGHSLLTKITVALAAIGVAGGAVWAASAMTGTTSAEQVQLEPTSSAGASPFMSPVGTDQSDLSPPAGSAGQFSGDTPGLFAQNGDKPSCDVSALTTDLTSDPTKAKAWAEALGITAEEIPAYVAGLTPVVLRSDTAVTSHGYENGSFSAYPAVLQAGTAVFVTGHGEPRVKCFSGNPLTEGTSLAQASYVGPGWEWFRPTSVTTVRGAPAVINNYVVIDVRHGRPTSRPGKPPWNGGNNGGKPGSGNGNPGGGNGVPTPNPILEAKAKEAQAKAEQAAKEATDARAIADDKQVAARVFATEARNLADADAAKLREFQAANQALGTARIARDAALAEAQRPPIDPAKVAAFEAADREFQKAIASTVSKAKEREETRKAAEKAKVEAEEKANQARMAEAAARSAEGTRAAAEAEATKAKEAAKEAARGGKNKDGKAPGGNDGPGDAKIAPEIAAQDDKPAEDDGQAVDPAAVEGAEQGAAAEQGKGQGQGQGEQLEGAAPDTGLVEQAPPSEAPQQQVQKGGDADLTEAGQ
jgi:hypothetical protein